MEIAQLDRVCRGCMCDEPNMRSIFAPGEPRIDQMLLSSTQLPISEDDGLPFLICFNCTHQLSKAFRFKQMCEQSDAKFRKYKSNLQSSTNNSIHDLTASVKEERNIQPTAEESTSIFKPTQIKEEGTTFELFTIADLNFNHNDDKMNVSIHCDKEASIDKERNMQTESVDNIKVYSCNTDCEKKFSSLIGLTNHLKSQHSMKDLVCCKECDKIYKNFSSFKKHSLEFHSQEITETPINQLDCQICKAVFTRMPQLKLHMLLHGKKKIYNCTNCDQGYNKFQSFEKHMVTCHPQASNNKESENNTEINNKKHNSINFLDPEMTIKEEPLDELLEEVERENGMFEDNSIDDEYDDDADFNVSEYEDGNSDGSDSPIDRRKTKEKLKRSLRTSRKHKIGKRQPKTALKHLPDLSSVTMDNALKEQSPEKIHKCDTCSKTFTRQDRLVRHMWCHSDNKPFPCDQCDKGFIRSEHLIRHKAALHSNKEKRGKASFCPICSRGFTTEKYLQIHMRMHTGDTTFMCKICNKNFNTKWHLKEHSKWHSAEKPFLCSECGQRFIRNDYLVTHMRRHKGEKPYKCRYCKKGFPRATDLTVHERYHTGEKTHLCTVCGKGFQRQYNLTVHLRVHTGEKPYECSFCGKKFAQGNDLKSHVRRHTGERFTCELCGEGFIQGYHLTHHKRAIHGMQCISHIRRVQKHPPPGLKKDKLASELASNEIKENANTQTTSESEEKPVIRHVNGNGTLQSAEMDLSLRAQAVPAIMPLVPLAMFPSTHNRI